MRYADYAEAMTVRTGDIHIPRIDMQEPLRMECQHFLDCVRTGAAPRSDGHNGLAVVKLLDAAQRSLAHNGSTVELS
jgi:predicted dehydrogenase